MPANKGKAGSFYATSLFYQIVRIESVPASHRGFKLHLRLMLFLRLGSSIRTQARILAYTCMLTIRNIEFQSVFNCCGISPDQQSIS
ncbi:MAG: hypothetical protein JWM11_6223 [Planctomycetaceae bacterium]|nr:hypothetical protein [Planctomycetaceae bacterium]